MTIHDLEFQLFAEQEDVQSPQIQLRFEWGSGAPSIWSGLVEIDNGRFKNPRSLGIEADESGTISVESGAVWIQRRSPRVYDGFDVTVLATGDSTISFTLQSAGSQPLRKHLKFKLSNLLNEAQMSSVEDGELRLLVQRKPGDALTVDIDRPHLIYSPSEQFKATVSLNHFGLAEEELTGILNWEIRSARSGTLFDSGYQNVSTATKSSQRKVADLQFPLPAKEGVYDIQLNFSKKQKFRVQRQVQVVVLNEETASPKILTASNSQLQLVDQFIPGDAGLLRKVSSRQRMKLLDLSLEKLAGIIPVLQSRKEEYGQKPNGETIWNAYQLNVRHPGLPHQLVVTANSKIAQNIGISLLEPNAAGQLMPVGLDSGMYFAAGDESRTAVSTKRRHSEARSIVEHRLIVWPKIREPIVLIHNMKSGIPLQLETVELYEVQAVETDNLWNQIHSTPKSRLIGPYMHKPMLPENFGASEAYDEKSQRSLDDWVTFHTAALRLAEYLHFQGYNSLLLGAFADGSTIYPSRLLQPTPRYDTGTYFSTGQDPIRKDVLELLFRIFDREKLVLVPELQFSTPLPKLEAILSEESRQSQEVELIGRDGRTWRETNQSYRGLTPYYNPLSPIVQQAVLEVVEEVVGRYQHHDSFRGLAVELSSMGYLQFPGLEWGYDDATIARFEKQTGIKTPNGQGRDRFRKRYDFLTNNARSKWIQWRCEELSRFHHRISKVVISSKNSARCIFSANRILRGSYPDDNLYDALKSGVKLEDLLRVKGLDFGLYKDQERLTLLRPSFVGSSEMQTGVTLEETINKSPLLDEIFASVQSGALFYNQPVESRIAGFDAMSPWQPAYTWLVTQPSPGGTEARKRFVHSLAVLDPPILFDGGWMIPLGQEDETRHIRDIYRSLPDVKFDRNEIQQQPAVVRIGRDVKKTYIYLINELSGPVDVELKLSCSEKTACRRLGRNESITLQKFQPSFLQSKSSVHQLKKKSAILRSQDRNQSKQNSIDEFEDEVSVVRFRLDASDIWACELDDPTVRVRGVKSMPNREILASIQRRIEKLDKQIENVKVNARLQPAQLENPGFENSTGKQNQLVGWEVSNSSRMNSKVVIPSAEAIENSAFWAYDSHNPRSGQSALLVASNQGGASLASTELALNGNTFLTMSLWMRSSRKSADVRLSLDGKFRGRKFVQFAEVQVTNEWQRYLFRVKEIPSHGLTQTKIRLESRQSGKLWVDDVDIQLHKLTPNEIRQLTKIFSAIKLAWDQKRYSDCQRLLESFWGQFLFDSKFSQVTELQSKAIQEKISAPEQKKKNPFLQLFRKSE